MHIYSSASVLEIREQESNLTENSKDRIKYDGSRKMKKWNTHKYLLSYNNNKNEMSENLDNLNWYKNRFKKAFDYVDYVLKKILRKILYIL